jgi:TolA-binding protein
MTNDMSRHELNRNQLAEYIDIGVDWAMNNRNAFYAVAGTVVGLLLFGVFFFTRLQDARLRSEEKLSMAQYMTRSNDASQAGQGLGLLAEVIRSNASSSTGIRAGLARADALMHQQNYTEAETTLQSIINTNNGDKKLLPFAYSMLGIIYENTGKYAQATGLYNAYLGRYPDHFLTPRIFESLARVQELSGNLAEAKATYERIVTMYPASAWTQNAQERIITISGELAKTPAPQQMPSGN